MLEHKEIQDKLLIYDVFGGELHYLSDSHSPSGHKLQNEPVSHLGCPENNLVNCFLLYNVPVIRLSRPIKLPEHRRITGIL
jgi:hypothetical protein